MKFLTPIVLIIVSFGLFYWYLYPTYNQIQTQRTSLASYNAAILKAQAASSRRDELVTTYNNFNSSDLDRLQKLLPDSIDNIQLLVDVNSIAQQFSDGITNIRISAPDDASSGVTVLGNQDSYGTLTLSFSTNMSYTSFQSFLQALEKSLRLLDVTNIDFRPTDGGAYDYNVTLKTYWLR